MAPAKLCASCTLLIVFLIIFINLSSQAAHFRNCSTTLPTGIVSLSAVHDGQDSIYILGGYQNRDVHKYSIATGLLDRIGNFTAFGNGAAVLANSEDIYYFGGQLTITRHLFGDDERSSAIWKYSTVHGNFTQVGSFPHTIVGTTAVWDTSAKSAYMIGGYSTEVKDLAKIYSFTEASSLKVAALLPETRDDAAAVWVPGQGLVYVFGGWVGRSAGWSDDILAYDPATSRITRVNATIPFKFEFPRAVLGSDSKVYIVGGGRLVQFSPDSLEIKQTRVENWPDGLVHFACVQARNRIYIIGGQASVFMHVNYVSQIGYIDLATADFEDLATPNSISGQFSDCDGHCLGKRSPGQERAVNRCCHTLFAGPNGHCIEPEGRAICSISLEVKKSEEFYDHIATLLANSRTEPKPPRPNRYPECTHLCAGAVFSRYYQSRQDRDVEKCCENVYTGLQGQCRRDGTVSCFPFSN